FMAIFREKGFLDAPPIDHSGFVAPTDHAQVVEMMLFFVWLFLSSGSEVIRLAITEALRGDAEVLEVFDEWQRQGDGRIEQELKLAGIADDTNAPRRALTY